MPKIFISYSHNDDLPFGPRREQWVKTFESALKETLGQRVGAGRVELWRDRHELDEITLFDAKIEAELDSADLLIAVLSQHYLNSKYCRRELQHFSKSRPKPGDLRIGSHSRIVKVYRAVVERADLRAFASPPEDLATEIDSTVGFQVYCPDGDDFRDALLHPSGMETVWQKADDLSRSIKRIIDESPLAAAEAAASVDGTPSAGSVAVAATGAGDGPVVYLAHTAGDLRELRARLRRELEDHGFTVLPERERPEEVDDYPASVRTDLARARLSVHLLGTRYGAIPEGSNDSAVETQLNLALADTRADFHTLVWSPATPMTTAPAAAAATTALTTTDPAAAIAPAPGVAAAVGGIPAPLEVTPEPRMLALRERVTDQSLPRSRMEYVRSGPSPLAGLVRDRLAELSQAAAASAAVAAAAATLPQAAAIGVAPEAAVRRPSIYLVCDKVDREDTRPLKEALEQLGFDVTRPPVEGTAKERDDDHQRCLVACDAVVVVWGKVREPWLRKKLSDVQQAAGWGRPAPLQTCIVLKGPPKTPAKDDFEPPPGVAVLDGGVPPPDLLRAALKHLLNRPAS